MSQIYGLKLTHSARFTKEQMDQFRAHYKCEDSQWVQEDETELWKPDHYWSVQIKEDPIVFKQLFPTIEVVIGEVVETTQALEIVHSLQRIEKQLATAMMQPKTAGVPNKPTYQSDGKTRVAMPEWFIAHIRTVDVLVNCCTDRLQEELNDGWHILAICPQPGQRRPDYIVGKL